MRALAIDPALRITVRAALTLLFAWAASHKLRDRSGFRATLANYDVLPARWLAPFSLLLVGAELGVAAGLNLSAFGTAAAITAAGMLVVYAGAIIINLLRGRRHIDCGCMGSARHQPLSMGLVVRNVVMAIAALASTLPEVARTLTWIDGVTVGLGVVTLALLYAAVDALLAQAGARRAAVASPNNLTTNNLRTFPNHV